MDSFFCSLLLSVSLNRPLAIALSESRVKLYLMTGAKHHSKKQKLKDLIDKTKKADHFLTRFCVCLFVRLDSIFEAHFGLHTHCGPPLNLTGLLQIDLARVEGHLGKKLCDIPRPGLNKFNKMFT